MNEEEDPSDSSGEFPHNDVDGILISPNPNVGEIAVLNPALHVLNRPDLWAVILHRTRRLNLFKKEYSTLDIRRLHTPTKADASGRVLIVGGEDYDKGGCEDGRFTVNHGINHVTYTGVDPFGNAVPCLAVVGEGLDTVKKHGPIMYPITLEEAIRHVDHPIYKGLWEKELAGRKRWNEAQGIKGPILLYHKDAALHEHNGGWALLTRFEPNIQALFADKLGDFADEEYIVEQLRNIGKRTVMWTESGWSSTKIGLGSPKIRVGDMDIAAYHGVEQEGRNLMYKGSILRFDKDYNVISRLGGPLMIPGQDDVLHETELSKWVSFPTAVVPDPRDERTLWIYSGLGDDKIGYRSTSLPWVLQELRDPRNFVIPREG